MLVREGRGAGRDTQAPEEVVAVSRDRGGGVSAARSQAGPCSAGSPLSGVSRRTWSCGHREQVRGLPRPASHTRKRGHPPALPWDRRAVAEGTAGLPGVGLARSPALLPARVSTWKPGNAPGGGLPPAPQLREAPVLGRGWGGQHHMLFKAQVGPGGLVQVLALPPRSSCPHL